MTPSKRSCEPTARGPRAAGFTLLEILIALVVLAVAILGVLGLLVGTTKVAGEVVAETYGMATARSAYDAIRLAGRDRAFAVEEGAALVRGFVLVERGVSNTVRAPGDTTPPDATPPPPLPTGIKDAAALAALRASDHVVLLPRRPTTGPASTYVFPRPGGAAADNGGLVDNALAAPIEAADGTQLTLDVKRVYPLALPPTAPVTGDRPASREMADQYGWALAIRCARAPVVSNPASTEALDWKAKGFLPDSSEVVDGLYEVRVMVFRNFDPDPAIRGHVPVVTFAGLVAVTP